MVDSERVASGQPAQAHGSNKKYTSINKINLLKKYS
jgi:hypothetical protein